MSVLLVKSVLWRGPEVVILTLSGDEFLFKWDPICRIRENLESPKASSQRGVPIEPLVMDGT